MITPFPSSGFRSSQFAGEIHANFRRHRSILAPMFNKNLFYLFLLAAPLWSQPEVIATGMPGATKITLTPQRNFLVSQPGMTTGSGRILFVSRSGVQRPLIQGLPSGVEVTLAGTNGPTAMAIHGQTLFVLFGNGDWERRGQPPTSIHNPEGASSPLFCSILAFRFNQPLDSLNGPFHLTPQHQLLLADGGEANLAGAAGETALVSVLARFPVSEPSPGVIYRFSNPWGMAVTEDGTSLYVTDASINSLARVDTATGRWRRLARFAPVSNPAQIGPPVTDSVPTNVRIYGNQVLVSFLTGFPFASGNARVLAVNPDQGTTEPFIYGLTSATDVLWRPRLDGAPEFYVTEFSLNQSANPAPPGRLLRFDSNGRHIVSQLITPVNMVLDETSNDLFVLELRGQIVRFRLD